MLLAKVQELATSLERESKRSAELSQQVLAANREVSSVKV